MSQAQVTNTSSHIWLAFDRVVNVGLHVIAIVAAYWAAFQLRFDFGLPPDHAAAFGRTVLVILGIKLVAFFVCGAFTSRLRNVTLFDLVAIAAASLVSLAVIFPANALDYLPARIPQSIPFLDMLTTAAFVGGLRSVWRLISEEVWPQLRRRLSSANSTRRVLILGNERAARLFAQQLKFHATNETDRSVYHVVGLIATDTVAVGTRIGGVRVMGHLEDAAKIALRLDVHDVLVTANAMTGKQLRALMEACTEANIHVRVIPAVQDIIENGRRFSIREIDINDLLQRDPVQLDMTAIGHLLEGRRVLITGAGGSIGSEICRQVLRFNPTEMILVEQFENNLFQIDRELQVRRGETVIHPRIADVTNEDRLACVFDQHRPHVVFHAAAHKHVPMMEMNAGEAVRNNIMGTKNVADMADRFGVDRFVLISTDKAVNPSSVMGCTKQIAERYVHSFGADSKTRFVVVRFGNVLASAGSVVPIFQEQIRRGGPVTVTHPDMQRFFMTIPEASQLVLQAAAMGDGGEIFVLDMGEPVKIADMARDLIRLSGFHEDEIDVVFTGVRPGEKLYEELYFDEEQILNTKHPKLHIAFHRMEFTGDIRAEVEKLLSVVNEPSHVVRKWLADIAPEYKPLHIDEPSPAEQPLVSKRAD